MACPSSAFDLRIITCYCDRELIRKIYNGVNIFFIMARKALTVDKEIHAGLISFNEIVPLKIIQSAAKNLAKLPEFIFVWIRGAGEREWGIEFLTKCNGICKGNISDEVRSWMEIIKIPKDKVKVINVSGEVIMVKPLI